MNALIEARANLDALDLNGHTALVIGKFFLFKLWFNSWGFY